MTIKSDREKSIVRKRALNAGVRDIHPLPVCADPVTRFRCDDDLLFFLMECFPNRFQMQFGQAHLDYIQELQTIIRDGGQRAIGMPRGSGKTTVFEPAIIWAAVTGQRKYTLALAATKPLAEMIHKNIKTELESNARLLELYPEAMHPIKMLEGTNRRALSQTHRGALTYVEFGGTVVFGRVGAVSDGCVIAHASMESSFRGLARLLPSGEKIRPDLVLIDDVLTDKGALSPSQNQKIEGLIEGAVLKLAGPNKTIACLLSGTVIQKGDACDRFLDNKKKPMWRGKRIPFFYSMPTDLEVWERWKDIYIADVQDGTDRKNSLGFYRDNKAKMDAGASVSWEARMEKGDPNAVYYGMRKWAEDPVSFQSEYQLQPTDRFESFTSQRMKEDDLMSRLSPNLRQGDKPKDEHAITCGIDFNQNAMTWQVMAWTKGVSTIIDYGFWPEQPSRYFKMRDAVQTIERRYPAPSYEQSAGMALEDLLTRLREKYRPEATLIDCNWEPSTEAVKEQCRKFAKQTLAIYLPARGKYVGPSETPISEWKKLKGEVLGNGWRITTKNRYTYVIHDPNYIKSSLYRMWAKNLIDIYNPREAAPNHHLNWAQQRCSEYAVALSSAVRSMEKWEQLPNYPDNHLLDTEVLNFVANGIIGRIITPKYKKQVEASAKTDQPKKNKVTALAW